MKYLKKTTALLLSVLLLFSAMVTGATVLADGNTATITVASVEAAAGASIEVPVTISGNDIGGAYFTVDVDGLTVNDVTIGENFKDWGNDELTYALTVAADEAFAGEAVLVTLNVAVPADAAEGTVYDITFTDVTVSGWNDDETDVATTVEAGAVTVKAAEAECEHSNATLEYSVVGGACVTTKVCDCGYDEVIATVAAERPGQDTGLRIFRAPILDSGLAFAFRTLTASSAGYTDIYGEFTKECYVRDGSDTLTTPEVTRINAIIDPDYNGVRYKFLYEGIRSYEMCSNINIKIFGTNAEGYVCFLGTLDYAFANYIQNNYASSTGTLKTLLGDLAFYGAAAQDYFKYHYSAKPNKGIENEHSALPTSFDTTDNVMPGGITISKAPDLANKVLINFRFNQADVEEYGSDLRFEVDYIDAKGNPATFVKKFEEFEPYQTNRYQIVFDQLVAARINNVVTAKVVTSTGTIVGQLEYTLEKYAYNRYNGADKGTPFCILTQALVNYGDAAKAHFG